MHILIHAFFLQASLALENAAEIDVRLGMTAGSAHSQRACSGRRPHKHSSVQGLYKTLLLSLRRLKIAWRVTATISWEWDGKVNQLGGRDACSFRSWVRNFSSNRCFVLLARLAKVPGDGIRVSAFMTRILFQRWIWRWNCWHYAWKILKAIYYNSKPEDEIQEDFKTVASFSIYLTCALFFRPLYQHERVFFHWT